LATWLEGDQLCNLPLACSTHTDGRVSVDPMIDCGYDADRLDLRQFGTTVDERFLSTEAAKRRLSDGTRCAKVRFRASVGVGRREGLHT
jgi:hypothetical protein